MRFLKSKIVRSAESKRLQSRKEDEVSSPEKLPLKTLTEGVFSLLKHPPRKDSKSSCKSEFSPRKSSSENIIKNYGRAMTNFALSSLALPYLKTILPKSGSNLSAFLSFIKKKKKSANCIKKIREMLPSRVNQDGPNIAEKMVFQELCVIFLKFFSVNWLFNSKIDNKGAHLGYRFKILRRVRDPDHFTYLKDFRFEK